MMLLSRTFLIASIAGLFLLPWEGTIALALLAALGEPLAPFIVGILADALYVPHAHTLPVYSLIGLVFSLIAYGVHKHAKASIIK